MAKLDLSQVVSAVAQGAPNWQTLMARALQRIEDGVNNLGQQVAAEPVGFSQPPAPLQSVNVKTAGEMVHVTLTHNVPIQKNVHYFVEYDTDPSFPQPHVIHNGTSRTVPPFTLPTQDDNGNPVNYYFRGYPQFPGSHPAAPVNHGGTTPTAVTLGGLTQMSLLPSTGSGTAAADGQQGGYGFGKTNTRPAIAPKRSIPA
jgi:hypothetical protein